MDSETVQVLTSLSNDIGFPIFICILLIYQNKKTVDKYDQMLNELNKTIRDWNKVLVELVGELKKR